MLPRPRGHTFGLCPECMRLPPRSPAKRLLDLVLGALRPPPGPGRIALAYAYGAVCHLIFAAAVLAMVAAMYFGMSESFGRVPAPWHIPANALLLLQFPLAHSVLLSARGRAVLARLAPAPHGRTLATTSYAIIASAQLLALFALRTSGNATFEEIGSVIDSRIPYKVQLHPSPRGSARGPDRASPGSTSFDS